MPLLGTLPENVVSGLEAMGYHAVWFENASAERLHTLVRHNWPVITLLQAEDLPDGVAGLHAVVVTGLAGGQISFLDPMQTEPTVMLEPDFLEAWDNLDNQGIVIWIQPTPE
ncbi:MAG: hypothetical protein AAF702_13120 [Chloroflexota bacterium]